MNLLTYEERAEILALKAEGVNMPNIAKRVKVGRNTVRYVIDNADEVMSHREPICTNGFELMIKRSDSTKALAFSYAGPEPTPDEIAAACREIRKTWDPEERQRRIVGRCGSVEVTRFRGRLPGMV